MCGAAICSFHLSLSLSLSLYCSLTLSFYIPPLTLPPSPVCLFRPLPVSLYLTVSLPLPVLFIKFPFRLRHAPSLHKTLVLRVLKRSPVLEHEGYLKVLRFQPASIKRASSTPPNVFLSSRMVPHNQGHPALRPASKTGPVLIFYGDGRIK